MKATAAIGSRIEMFVDDWLIESRQGVEQRLNPPLRREVVLVTDKPWEGADSYYYTVFQDNAYSPPEGLIRLWYRGFCLADLSDQQVTCYAESKDGVHFTRPDLSLYEFESYKQNNIVWRGVEGHNFAPFLDTNPNASPEERYKAVAGLESKLYGFSSPDGICWKKIKPEPIITQGAFDSQNIAFWDTVAQVYRCYSRSWTGGGYEGFRAIQSSISPDFLGWSEPQPNRYAPGVPMEHFYTNATVPCPGAPHIYLSFPKRFLPERKKVADYEHPGVSDAVFMSSRDGVNWDRTFLEAWVRPGPDQRNWTQRSNMPAWGIVQTSADEFSLYIGEHYMWPDNRLRRLTVRRHGFAAIHAGYAGGEFTTRPVTFTGRRLLLNYATSAAGSVQVEVQDKEGKPITGFALSEMDPLYGDELDAVVGWRGGSDLSALIGRPVRLRFLLKDADIYALRTGDGA